MRTDGPEGVLVRLNYLRRESSVFGAETSAAERTFQHRHVVTPQVDLGKYWQLEHEDVPESDTYTHNSSNWYRRKTIKFKTFSRHLDQCHIHTGIRLQRHHQKSFSTLRRHSFI